MDSVIFKMSKEQENTIGVNIKGHALKIYNLGFYKKNHNTMHEKYNSLSNRGDFYIFFIIEEFLVSKKQCEKNILTIMNTRNYVNPIQEYSFLEIQTKRKDIFSVETKHSKQKFDVYNMNNFHF